MLETWSRLACELAERGTRVLSGEAAGLAAWAAAAAVAAACVAAACVAAAWAAAACWAIATAAACWAAATAAALTGLPSSFDSPSLN